MAKPENPADLKQVLNAVVRLCRNIDSLEKNVARLAGRIRPYDNEVPPHSKPWLDQIKSELAPNPKNLMIVVKQADNHLEALERDFSAVRATIDQISNDAWLRDDIKQFIDTPRRRNEKKD